MNYELEGVCKLKFILNTVGQSNFIEPNVDCRLQRQQLSKPELGSWLHESLCMMSVYDKEDLILIMITT